MQKDWEIHWEDYYKILQVHPSAELEVIKAAYQKLAQKYHPDINKDPAAGERMKKINLAYEVLSDPEERRQYDSEWFLKGNVTGKSALPKPKPVVDPGYIHFKDVEPQKTQMASFIVRNTGGPYAKIRVSNPDSWVRVVRGFPLTNSDELPLQVEVEAEGDDWDKNYSEIIRVRLDEEETQVKVELQTKPAPVREKAKVGARPNTGPTHATPLEKTTITLVLIILVVIMSIWNFLAPFSHEAPLLGSILPLIIIISLINGFIFNSLVGWLTFIALWILGEILLGKLPAQDEMLLGRILIFCFIILWAIVVWLATGRHK